VKVTRLSLNASRELRSSVRVVSEPRNGCRVQWRPDEVTQHGVPLDVAAKTARPCFVADRQPEEVYAANAAADFALHFQFLISDNARGGVADAPCLHGLASTSD
jgi:hypothetical protein